MLLEELAKKRINRKKDERDYRHYADNPVGFVKDVLGVAYLTPDQEKILNSVIKNRETYVQSCHGIGKTQLSAWCLLHFVFCRKSLVVSTAPVARQVRELLWGYVRKAYDMNHKKLGGERGQLFLRLTETARAYGYTASDTQSFQGVHASSGIDEDGYPFGGLLLILDEAGGIQEEIWDAARACVVGDEDKILAVSNPIVTGTGFEKVCRKKSIRIPAWTHPNISPLYFEDVDGIHKLKPEIKAEILNEFGEVKPQSQWASWIPRDKIPGAISASWIEDVRAKKGQDSNYWLARVEGIFPESSGESIIPRDWIRAARARYDADPAYWDAIAENHPWRSGMDIADSGGDCHGLASWKGPILYFAKIIPTRGDREEITRAAGLAKQHLETHVGSIAIDRVGVGAGVLSILVEQGLDAEGFCWGSAASDSDTYLNLKIEQYWNLRESFRLGEVAIAPLGEEIEQMLYEDFSASYYEITSTAKLRMEDKQKTKARLHRSPDLGDACIYAFNCTTSQIEFQSTGVPRLGYSY